MSAQSSNPLQTLTLDDQPSYIYTRIISVLPPRMDAMGEEEMDPRVWRKLPQGLLDRVLVFLPPPAFFRFRSICRRFYGLLFSNAFLEMHLRLAPRLDWFLFFEHRPPVYVYSAAGGRPVETRWVYLLDPRERAWYRVPFADGSMTPLHGYSPAASSGGLLCLLADEPGLKPVALWNPLSMLVGQLPETSRPRLFPSVGLAVGHSSFSVQVAGDDMISPLAVKNLTSEGFHADAATGLYSPWASVSPLPRLCNLESGRMVFVGGRFYCMNYSPFSVLSYAGNEWAKIQAPMRRFLRSPSLVECDGRLVLVAVVEKSKLNVPRSVRLWELQPCGRAWVELERMPPQTYAEFAAAEGRRGFECVGQGGLVVVTLSGEHMLVFELRRRVWRWLPRCPFLAAAAASPPSSCLLRGFGFEPRLATPAIGLVASSSLVFQP